MTRPNVLVIAGLDPSGGAGLVADVRVCEQHDCRPLAVATALTEQSTAEVRAANPVAATIVGDQLRTLLTDIELAAVKIGMLGSEQIVDEVARALELTAAPVVWDPVLRATAGRLRLYDGDPATGVAPFDLEHVPFIEANATYVSRVRHRPDGPGAHAIQVVAQGGGRQAAASVGLDVGAPEDTACTNPLAAPTSVAGHVTRIGEDRGQSSLHMHAEFPVDGPRNLGAARVTIDRLLHEPGGTGETNGCPVAGCGSSVRRSGYGVACMPIWLSWFVPRTLSAADEAAEVTLSLATPAAAEACWVAASWARWAKRCTRGSSATLRAMPAISSYRWRPALAPST